MRNKKILLANESEVRDMMLAEYDENAIKDVISRQSYDEGKTEGKAEGRVEGKNEGQVMV